LHKVNLRITWTKVVVNNGVKVVSNSVLLAAIPEVLVLLPYFGNYVWVKRVGLLVEKVSRE
jgi:hypothetical protein